MNNLQFFTTLQIGWLNAWIPAFAMVLVQFVYMAIYKEGGKRAVDTSWYTAKDKMSGGISSLLQILLLILSLFVPLKMSTTWFWVGAAIYVLAFAAFIWSFYSYGAAAPDKAIQGGIYRWSRNPMYFFYFVGTLGICIATASLWLLLVLIPFSVFTHLIILGEERYCEQTYGESYLAYKKKTPRYLLFF
ncbi:methyltransferase family protein [Bacteroides heparinolyticus]|uniref:methyltransferase family protein n=1 Tax=Prevotella heparinolytica TaxID=28113 RepID=UPI00359F9834